VSINGQKLTLHGAHRVHRETSHAAYDTAPPRSMTGQRYLRQVTASRRATNDQYERPARAFRPALNDRIDPLSVAHQQKLALVAAFLGSPKLIVLDEPTRGLDVLSREVVLEAVRTASLQGAAVILSSQYPSEIVRSCSRLLLFKDGTLAHDLSQDDIAQHTGKNVTIYTDDTMKLPPHAIRLRTGSHRKVKFSYT